MRYALTKNADAAVGKLRADRRPKIQNRVGIIFRIQCGSGLWRRPTVHKAACNTASLSHPPKPYSVRIASVRAAHMSVAAGLRRFDSLQMRFVLYIVDA